MTPPEPPESALSAAAAPAPPWRFLALLLGAYLMVAFALYDDALDGPFVSDDVNFILENPYVRTPGPGWLPQLFDARGEHRKYLGGNYAPVVHVAHAIEWRLWGTGYRRYHMVNVALHALVSLLLACALARSGLSEISAALGGLLFLVHPANVEGVAWISQLRNQIALGAALCAFLGFARRPLLSPLWLAFGLLAKAPAAFILPLLAQQAWQQRADPVGSRSRVAALALCIAVFLVYAPLQLDVFTSVAADPNRPYPDLATWVRSIGAIGARYLAMAATGYGTAAYHSPEPVDSFLDPWWLAGLVALPLFLWRITYALPRPTLEAGWWITAGAAFVPISQVIPFLFPMGDRYLYFILPGLIAGSALALQGLGKRFAARADPPPWSPRAPLVVWTLTGLLALAFALQAQERAGVWKSVRRLYADSARAYPDSSTAHFVAAIDAMEKGDKDEAFRRLHVSLERGGDQVQDFASPVLASLKSDPRYDVLIAEVAKRVIARAEKHGNVDPLELSRAHVILGDLDGALEVLQAAIRAEGLSFELMAAAQKVRARIAAREREQAPGAAKEAPLP